MGRLRQLLLFIKKALVEAENRPRSFAKSLLHALSPSICACFLLHFFWKVISYKRKEITDLTWIIFKASYVVYTTSRPMKSVISVATPGILHFSFWLVCPRMQVVLLPVATVFVMLWYIPFSRVLMVFEQIAPSFSACWKMKPLVLLPGSTCVWDSLNALNKSHWFLQCFWAPVFLMWLLFWCMEKSASSTLASQLLFFSF